MLTKETIKSNAALATLTDEQVNAVTELSKNDEAIVMGEKTRTFWDSIDKDIKDVTGEEKPMSTKSYVHLKTTLSAYKTKADNNNSADLQKQIDTLKTEKGSLEKAIADGSTDGALKTKVTNLEKQIGDNEATMTKLRNDLTTKDTEMTDKVKAEADKNVDLRFATTFADSLFGVKFLAGIPQSAIDATISAAKRNTKGKGAAEFETNADGSESITFRNEKGLVITNPENLQKPLTAKEDFLSQLGDIIDTGRSQKGGGGKPGKPASTNPTILDFSQVTTKVQAGDTIREHLKGNDVQPGSNEFQEQYQQLYDDNKVGDLPTQ